MLTELFALSNLAITLVVTVGVLNIINFIRQLYDTILLPILSPILPVISDLIRGLLDFLAKNIPITVEYIKNSIEFIKKTVLGIFGKYKRISKNKVQAIQKVYIMDEFGNFKCVEITGSLDYNNLPLEIKNNMGKNFNHSEDLIKQLLLKLKK
jgi:hypothetical protein